MPLNPAAADAVAAQICSALGVTDPTAQNQWKQIVEPIYAGILANLLVTLQPGTVVTVGSPTTQTGPASPVVLTLT